jgi:MFS family permease
MYGRLSDIFGRKAILLGSMAFLLLGSILCAVSQSMTMLIIFGELQFSQSSGLEKQG